jgi:small ubiquitin-related modifier
MLPWHLAIDSNSPWNHPSFTHTNASFQQTGEETFFKIKKSTKMSKVFETYAQRKGVQSSSLRFLLDGERIDGDNTPKMLELDDQDQIDCMLEQTGGN